MGTLSIHPGLDRAHITALRGSLEDLIYLITVGLHRVYVGQEQGSPGRHQLSIRLTVQELHQLQLNCPMRHQAST